MTNPSIKFTIFLLCLWIVVSNLWGAVIGRPSLLKSPAIAEVMKPLERLILESMKEHKFQQSHFEKQNMIGQSQERDRYHKPNHSFSRGNQLRQSRDRKTIGKTGIECGL